MKDHVRKLNRLSGYDYKQPGYYFITICSKIRNDDIFGRIDNGKMIVNECGNILQNQWLWLADQYSYIGLDAWIIMPDHVHGIIVIKNDFGIDRSRGRDRSRPVPTTKTMDTEIQPVRIKSLSEIVGAYKTTTSKIIHIRGYNHFAWQRSFYDHIIRDDESLHRIRQYIVKNPLNWNPKNNGVDFPDLLTG